MNLLWFVYHLNCQQRRGAASTLFQLSSGWVSFVRYGPLNMYIIRVRVCLCGSIQNLSIIHFGISKTIYGNVKNWNHRKTVERSVQFRSITMNFSHCLFWTHKPDVCATVYTLISFLQAHIFQIVNAKFQTVTKRSLDIHSAHIATL